MSFSLTSVIRRHSLRAKAFVALAAVTVLAHPAEASGEDYRLSSGDVISFDFLDDNQLPISLTVSADGQTQFPFIGGVNVTGLTVQEAIATIGNEYKRREILKDPKIGLNVVSFRPIFVLGEVRNPGSFAFSPGLTVDQAIGLAGGTQSALTNPSDRIVARARLRGEIEGAEAEIVNEAIYTARLKAQMRGSDKLDLNDAPEMARPFLQGKPLDGVVEIEEQILKTDLITMDSQTKILTQGISETEEGLNILAQLEVQQKDVVAMNDQDLDRAMSLRKRELNTEADLSRVKSNASVEKSRLLEIYAEMSRSRRELGSLKLDLAKLQADREKDILVKLQERDVNIKKLDAQRRSTQEQYFLLTAAAADDKKKNQVSFTYQIQRNQNDLTKSFTASTDTKVLPGDVVSIAIVGM